MSSVATASVGFLHDARPAIHEEFSYIHTVEVTGSSPVLPSMSEPLRIDESFLPPVLGVGWLGSKCGTPHTIAPMWYNSKQFHTS
jgi:hypothetical protein